jgi:long-chain acyl-CoA synthetase
MTATDGLGFWRLAERDPDRVAIVDPDASGTTFGELLADSRAIARGLRALGVRAGDGIAVLVPNHRVFFEAYLAAMETGLYFTPVNWHLAAPEVAYVVDDCEAKAVVTHPVTADLAVRSVPAADFPADRLFSWGAAAGCRPLDELKALGEDDSRPLERTPGQIMMYTSGTTGRPKGVRRRLKQGDPDQVFGDQGVLFASGFGFPVGHGVSIVTAPMYHASPQVNALNGLHVGHTVVLMDKFDAEEFLSRVERYGVTDATMAPILFHRLLQVPEERRRRYDTSSLQSMLHAGAPCPPDVKAAMIAWWGPIIHEF